MADISRETFVEALHDALNHLYNNDLLRKSPLADWFGLANRFDTSTALRKTISEAIDSLKPPPSEPDSSKSWRTYESLYCCFVQQLNQQVVADQLSISPRQLRREQRNALEELADALWRRFHLGNDATAAGEGKAAPPESPAQAEADSLIGEFGWLMEAQPVKPERLAEEVEAALAVVRPLAEKQGVKLRNLVSGNLPGLAIHSAALNQILISLLSLAIQQAVTAAQGAEDAQAAVVHVAARRLPLAVETIIELPGARQPAPERPRAASVEEQASLKIAGELARLSGGRIFTGDQRGLFPIRLILPALEQVPVLVVDDNEDSLQLVKRFAAGTRYNLACTRESDNIIALVESIKPRIIVLDIMMPKENGWIVLGRLRQHPLTADIPVIISTILPQEKLALSLGASAFLKKPVTRQSLLRALDQQFALLEPEYR